MGWTAFFVFIIGALYFEFSSAQIVNYTLYPNALTCAETDGGFYPNAVGSNAVSFGRSANGFNTGLNFRDYCLSGRFLREGVCGNSINLIYAGYFGTFDTDCNWFGRVCLSNALLGTPDACIVDFCGTGICGPGENVTLCQEDCAGICGDGLCNNFFENNTNCPADCVSSSHYWLVFVSPNVTNGLLGNNETLALANADLICQNEANNLGYNGNFTAWLSTSGINAESRIVNGGFVGAPQQIIAYSKSDLLDGSLANAINNSIGAELVWTGTNANGTLSVGNFSGSNANCNDWTSLGGWGAYGDSALRNSHWSLTGNHFNCSFSKHLYCFQTG